MEKTVSENLNRKPQSTAYDLVIQELKDETLIYNLAVNKAICLNATAAFVWKKCDGRHSVAEIARELARQTNQPVNEDIVWLTLDLLTRENLIVEDEPIAAPFGAISRREALRKVGLGTMIALPAISLLVAPTAAAASSGRSTPSNGACTSDCSTVLGGACACLSSVTCAPNAALGAALGVGVCVNASVAVNAGISVSGGANGNVCLFTNACVTL